MTYRQTVRTIKTVKESTHNKSLICKTIELNELHFQSDHCIKIVIDCFIIVQFYMFYMEAT